MTTTANIKKAMGPGYNMPVDAVEFVHLFLSHLARLATPKEQRAPSRAELAQIIHVPHATGAFKLLKSVDGKEFLATRVTSLGDYMGAVKRIVRNADSTLGRRAGNVRMEQVCKAVIYLQFADMMSRSCHKNQSNPVCRPTIFGL